MQSVGAVRYYTIVEAQYHGHTRPAAGLNTGCGADQMCEYQSLRRPLASANIMRPNGVTLDGRPTVVPVHICSCIIVRALDHCDNRSPNVVRIAQDLSLDYFTSVGPDNIALHVMKWHDNIIATCAGMNSKCRRIIDSRAAFITPDAVCDITE